MLLLVARQLSLAARVSCAGADVALTARRVQVGVRDGELLLLLLAVLEDDDNGGAGVSVVNGIVQTQ